MKKPENNIPNQTFDINDVVSIADDNISVNAQKGEYIYLDSIDGVITQPEEIETVKNRQVIDVLKNQLLGQFNGETGRYEIAEDIRVELSKIVKIESSVKKNTVFAESLSSFGGLGKLEFVVRTCIKKSVVVSELFVFEGVYKMAKTVQNTHIHSIAIYRAVDADSIKLEELTWNNYFEEMYKYFRIIKPAQKFSTTEDEAFLQGWIVRRKLYLKTMGTKLDPLIEQIETDLLLERIEILSRFGEYGYKVLKRFESIKSNAKNLVNGELGARDQNEMLEESFEGFRNTNSKELGEFYQKQLPTIRKYNEMIITVREQNKDLIISGIDHKMPSVLDVIINHDKKQKAKEVLNAGAEKQEQKAPEKKQEVKEDKPKADSPKPKKPEEKKKDDKKPVEQKKEPLILPLPVNASKASTPGNQGKVLANGNNVQKEIPPFTEEGLIKTAQNALNDAPGNRNKNPTVGTATKQPNPKNNFENPLDIPPFGGYNYKRTQETNADTQKTKEVVKQPEQPNVVAEQENVNGSGLGIPISNSVLGSTAELKAIAQALKDKDEVVSYSKNASNEEHKALGTKQH